MVTECEIPPAQFLDEKPDMALARPGVYLMFCDANGKYYVGSSINIRLRITQHETALRTGKHISPKVRGSYEKYGPRSMHFCAAEFCDGNQNDLLASEKRWIEKLDAVTNGLNISSEPSGNRGIKRSDEVRAKLSLAMLSANLTNGRGASFNLVSPLGEAFSGSNLAQFCRARGMSAVDKNCLLKVVNGDAISHKGWRSVGGRGRKLRVDKPFRLMPPKDFPVCGSNLRVFCEDNNLDYAQMGALVRGERESYNEWTLSGLPREITKKPRTKLMPRKFISPTGETVSVNNLAEFCRNNKLTHSAMSQVLSGKRPHHKQWRKYQCS